MERVSRKKFAAGMLALLEKYPRKHVLPLLAREIVARGWSGDVDVLLAAVAQLWLERKRHLSARVVSARPLPDRVLKAIKMLLESVSNATSSDIQADVDPTLKGGVIAYMPLGQFDVSIRNQLNQLKHLS